MAHFLIFVLVISATAMASNAKYKFSINKSIKDKDMMHKYVVFDTKTPDVFYCSMQKPSKINNFIVKSKPLEKLCEYEGRSLPAEYKSDCYQDIDESNYACKEKYRIMKYFVQVKSKTSLFGNIIGVATKNSSSLIPPDFRFKVPWETLSVVFDSSCVWLE